MIYIIPVGIQYDNNTVFNHPISNLVPAPVPDIEVLYTIGVNMNILHDSLPQPRNGTWPNLVKTAFAIKL